MVRLIADLEITVVVHINAITEAEGAVAGRISSRARHSGHSGAIGTIPGPQLHSVVERIENVDRYVGDDDIVGLFELIRRRSDVADDRRSRG